VIATFRLAAVAAALALAASAGAQAAGVISGTAGDDKLVGTTGDDSLYGRAGNDRLDGGPGNDSLDGGRGSDDIYGGAGQDAVSYSSSLAGVTATLDKRANDGAPGESDNLRTDVEDVYGSTHDDVLTGDGRANTIDGGAGNDTITGGRGTDGLFGGPGDDVIDAKDGTQDLVDCGPGTDIVNADKVDSVSSCEKRGKGRTLPSVKATGLVTNIWTATARYTTVNRLLVHDISPAGASVLVNCHGDGCPFARRTFPGPTVELTPAFRGRRLSVGTRLEIFITAPEALSKYVGFTMRRTKVPLTRFACAAPDSMKPIRCP
jgi:Ca2+-binding RTX toxin-like protein